MTQLKNFQQIYNLRLNQLPVTSYQLALAH